MDTSQMALNVRVGKWVQFLQANMQIEAVSHQGPMQLVMPHPKADLVTRGSALKLLQIVRNSCGIPLFVTR